MLPLLSIYTAAGVVLGHNFPFYMNFRGGKGIAATAGLILSMSWQMTLLGILTFGTAVALTHYVSLGSLLVYIGFLIELIVFGQNGMFGMSQAYLNEMYVVAVLLTALAFFMHRANIVRLVHGTERKTYLFRHKKNRHYAGTDGLGDFDLLTLVSSILTYGGRRSNGKNRCNRSGQLGNCACNPAK